MQYFPFGCCWRPTFLEIISFKNHLEFTFVKLLKPIFLADGTISNQFTDNQFCQYNTMEKSQTLAFNVTSPLRKQERSEKVEAFILKREKKCQFFSVFEIA